MFDMRESKGMDHPRSRGEYKMQAILVDKKFGSSPLSRGILAVTYGLAERKRIIPALAGNTTELP